MKTTAPAAMLLGLIGTANAASAAPAWIDGKDPRYTRKEFILGVGKGPTRQAADVDARAELSRIFESNVASVAKDFQAAASRVNSSGKGVSVEVQSTAVFTQVTTQKTLAATELREHTADGATNYTLAVLARGECITSLTEQIGALDARISAAVTKAQSAEKLDAFKAYGAALNLIDDREGLNAMLRVCDLSGKGIAPPVSIGELAAKFDEASGQLRLGIDLQGSGSGRVKDCLMEMLGQKGYQILDIQVEDDDSDDDKDDAAADTKAKAFDAVLRGRLKSEKAGDVAGSDMVRTQLILKLINPSTHKTLKTITASRKEGRASVKASAALAAYKICQKEMPSVVKELDKYFKR